MKFININGEEIDGPTFEDWDNNTVIFAPSSGNTVSLNPLHGVSEDAMFKLLYDLCSEELHEEDDVLLREQINALVPCLITLRDAGHINEINLLDVVNKATLDGFWQLSEDFRLPNNLRMRCLSVKNKMVSEGVKSLLSRVIH